MIETDSCSRLTLRWQPCPRRLYGVKSSAGRLTGQSAAPEICRFVDLCCSDRQLHSQGDFYETQRYLCFSECRACCLSLSYERTCGSPDGGIKIAQPSDGQVLTVADIRKKAYQASQRRTQTID